MHDAITKLYDGLHDAGKRADALRVAEKKPLDDQVKAIQERYNPLVQPKKGKVDMGKAAWATCLAAWRARIAAEKRAEAERVAKLAAEAEAAARAAMAESAGNLEARVVAEQHVENAKAWTTAAKRAEKAATTGWDCGRCGRRGDGLGTRHGLGVLARRSAVPGVGAGHGRRGCQGRAAGNTGRGGA
jgi:membrane protein involved in colicin uptake